MKTHSEVGNGVVGAVILHGVVQNVGVVAKRRDAHHAAHILSQVVGEELHTGVGAGQSGPELYQGQQACAMSGLAPGVAYGQGSALQPASLFGANRSAEQLSGALIGTA